jgi:2-keto-4-pentenoate hydratase
MDETTQRAFADRLHDAAATRIPIARLTESADLTIADAYGIQLALIQRWERDGRVEVGHKVGLTSAAIQQQLGVDQPDFGRLYADMFHAEALPIDLSAFIAPRVEPEITFVLNQDLAGPGVTVAEAISAVAYVVPSLEIIDSRIADWNIKLADTIADNASSGGVVLGSTPTALADVDLRVVGCVLERNGVIAGTGAGAAALGSPINALVWLANTIGEFGVGLKAGQVVMPGSLTAAVPVGSGDVVRASFGGLGTVTAVFA